MFVNIKYGRGSVAILNMNCRIMDFVECIKQKCDCEKGDKVDIVDEQCQFKNLDKLPPTDSIASLLDARTTYVPIIVGLDVDFSKSTSDLSALSTALPYKCLLQDDAFQKKLYEEYVAALALREQQNSRKTGKPNSRRSIAIPQDATDRSDSRKK